MQYTEFYGNLHLPPLSAPKRLLVRNQKTATLPMRVATADAGAAAITHAKLFTRQGRKEIGKTLSQEE